MESACIPSARPTLSGRVCFGPPHGYPGVTFPTVAPERFTVEPQHVFIEVIDRAEAKALGFSPIDNFNEDMLRLNCEAFGGYCGECHPRIPMRRPKAYSPGQGGSGRRNTGGLHQDCSSRKTTGSFQRNRDRIRTSLYKREIQL